MLNSRALTESLHVPYSVFVGGGGGKIVNSLCYQNEEYPLLVPDKIWTKNEGYREPTHIRQGRQLCSLMVMTQVV